MKASGPGPGVQDLGAWVPRGPESGVLGTGVLGPTPGVQDPRSRVRDRGPESGLQGPGSRVQGSGSRVQGTWFRVQVQGPVSRVGGPRSTQSGVLGFGVQGLGSRGPQGPGFGPLLFKSESISEFPKNPASLSSFRNAGRTL